MTSRRVQALGLALVITVLTVFALAGSSRLSGPVLWTISREHGHGIHRDDLVVVACWLAGMTCCWRLWRG